MQTPPPPGSNHKPEVKLMKFKTKIMMIYIRDANLKEPVVTPSLIWLVGDLWHCA